MCGSSPGCVRFTAQVKGDSSWLHTESQPAHDLPWEPQRQWVVPLLCSAVTHVRLWSV